MIYEWSFPKLIMIARSNAHCEPNKGYFTMI